MVWRVVIAKEIDANTRFALQRRGIVHVSGHAGRGFTSSTVITRAPSEADARRKVAKALNVPETFIREANRPPIWVYALVARENAEAFEAAIDPDTDCVDSIIERDAPESRVEVAFELPQGPADEVFAEARRLYAQICRRAGIPVPKALELHASGFEVFLEHERRELFERAEDLCGEGHYDLAVIIAQTACEVLVADVMRTLLEGHASDDLLGWLMGRVTTYALRDDPTRDLWNRLTKTQTQKEDWWDGYVKHVKRRHKIVHEGERVDADAARASLESARALSLSSTQRLAATRNSRRAAPEGTFDVHGQPAARTRPRGSAGQ